MTNTKQDKSAKPAAVELRDDALDEVSGGGGDITLKGSHILQNADWSGVDLAITKPRT